MCSQAALSIAPRLISLFVNPNSMPTPRSAELAEADIRIPIIFMTGHGDIPMSVKAMKAGAIDFLTKPFRDQDILDAVIRALERDQKRRDGQKTVSELRILFDSLTSREREVMTHVADGLMNKQIAAKFGITEITERRSIVAI
jgi:FixJ family two-component response regulator